MRATDRAIERVLAGDLRAQAPTPLSGIRLAARCACGHRFRRAILDQATGRYQEHCSRCGAPWPRHRVAIARRQITGGRRPDPERKVIDRVVLRRSLERLSSQHARVFMRFLGWPGPGRADAGISAELGLSAYRVRELVRETRSRLASDHRGGDE